MHKTGGANWKKSETRENADKFVMYPPDGCSLCKVAASPGSAVEMSLSESFYFFSSFFSHKVEFFLLAGWSYISV